MVNPASSHLVDTSNICLNCIFSINWVGVWHDFSMTSWREIYLGKGEQKGGMNNKNNYTNCRYFAQRLIWFLIVIALININWNQWYSTTPHSPVPNLKGLEIGHHYTCGWSKSSRGKCWLLRYTCRLWSYFCDWWMIFGMPVDSITLFKATKEISRNPTLLHICHPMSILLISWTLLSLGLNVSLLWVAWYFRTDVVDMINT